MNRNVLALLSKDELIDLLMAQEARIAELERRLGLNSRNSGKPPSSEGLKKPPRRHSLRQPSGRKSGGQKGHKGETLRQVAALDANVDHYPGTCSQCGSALAEATATRYSARQVFDLPQPRPLMVTEHRAHRCRSGRCGRCGRCGAETRASFSAGVAAPAQYGPRITAIVVYLAHYQLLPEDLCLPKTPLAAETLAFRTGTEYRPRHGCDRFSSPSFSTLRQRPWAGSPPA